MMHSANTNQTPAKSSHHRRKSSLSNSLSSSSVVTVRRSASLVSSRLPFRPEQPPLDPYPEADESPDGPPLNTTRPGSHHRRRSSVAHVAVDNSPQIKEGVGNLNRWSQSTASSRSSVRDNRQGSFSRRLSFSNSLPFSTLHGSGVLSPSPKKSPRTRSPALGLDDRPRVRPYSPPPRLPEPATSISPIDPLPLLPATVFDPTAPSSSASATPLTQPYSASTLASSVPDYFSHRSHTTTSPRGKRAGSKPRTQRAKSPLGSPPALEERRRPSRTAPSASRGPAPQGQRSASVSGRESRAPSSSSRAQRDRGHSDLSGTSEDEKSRSSSRARDRGEKDKKTMLSRALQKANTAVLLDNAQNFEGAMEAYGDACKLLQQVMLRSSGDDDRRKLEAIRVTYTNRIQELRLLDPAWQAASGKSLPARPMSNESLGTDAQSVMLDNASIDEPAIIGTATITRIVNDKSVEPDHDLPFRSKTGRESVLTTAIREVESGDFLRKQAARKNSGTKTPEPVRNLGVPMDHSYMPPPLSPRRPSSPSGSEERDPFKEPSVQEAMRLRPDSNNGNHDRDNSNESMSWLDTIDESGGSSCSSPSVHSVDNGEYRRKHLRSASGATEAEFDAALDAAVEAAYDDNLEPYEEDHSVRRSTNSSAHRRNVELAKERVREAEREAAVENARQRERENRLRKDQLPHVRGSVDSANVDPDAEEEERMLDEMTKEYMMDGFDFDLKSKSALPRQSDSSGFSSGSTWHSSTSSARNTAGTSLSTVAEGALPLSGASGTVSTTVALPSVDETDAAPMSPTAGLTSPPRLTTPQLADSGVRSRRLSGQNRKQLKIETSVKSPVDSQDPPAQQSYQLKVDASEEPTNTAEKGEELLPATTFKGPTSAPGVQSNLQPTSAPTPGISPADLLPAISPSTSLNQMISNENAAPGSPGRSKFPGKLGQAPAAIKKNKSSLSLRNRALSVSSPDGSESNAGTPISSSFAASITGRKPSNAHLVQTPSLPTFNLEGLGLPTGGMHLFDSDIHSPYDPGSPNPLAINGPIPLEPCPDAYLLRPFWLMRCFYQTLAHSRGGYLTSKLFIPRDIWGVKGVKIKAIEEKVANIDLLTAALLKLGSVDTYDADAVLEEMQALEVVLDQVQTNLIKKLGSEVGVNGVTNMFKDAVGVGSAGTTGPDGSTLPELPKSTSTSRSYLTSWKKLRSKNSGVGLANTFAVTKEVTKDSLTMPTLPMTSLPNIRFAKREVNQAEFSGPNANYMGALARLCDAVQILDQIARQVEDPGLKHSSPTHVGLELSTRHAAEFFGFYICRFVLQDVGMMIDKFIKRGSEWVLV